MDEQALRRSVEAIVREFEEEARALDTGSVPVDPSRPSSDDDLPDPAASAFDRGRQGGIRSVVFALKAKVLGISKIS